MIWLLGGLAVVAAVGVWLYRRWQRTRQAVVLTRLAVMTLFPDATVEDLPSTRARVRRGDRAVELDLFDAMDALGRSGLSGLLVYVGVALFQETSKEYRAEIEAFVLERLRAEHPDAKILEDDGKALTVRVGTSTFFLTRLPMLVELWGRDDEPASEREALARKILEARIASNDAASLRELVRPRFLTPNREARTMGTVAYQKKVRGLRYSVDYVVDGGRVCSPLHPLEHAELGSPTAGRLHALALDNLRARSAKLELTGERRLSVAKDGEDHAAVRVLLLPEQLPEGTALFVVAPTPGELWWWHDGDHLSARNARIAMKGAFDAEIAPIPKPVRVTKEGFTKSSWAEATGAPPANADEAQADG